jgi:hypothetical protein
MFGAAGLVGVAGNVDGTVVGGGFAFNEALGVEGAGSATAVGHALGDAAAVGVDEPGEVEHFSKGEGAEVEVEAGDEDIVISIEQVAREEEKVLDELALIDGDALDFFADFLFSLRDGLENFPWILGVEFEGIHFSVTVGVAAFDHARTALGIVAGLEQENILACVLAAHVCAAQQFGGFVATHRSHHQFKLACHVLALTTQESKVRLPDIHFIAGGWEGAVRRMEVGGEKARVFANELQRSCRKEKQS